jgi:hypothetical protein
MRVSWDAGIMEDTPQEAKRRFPTFRALKFAAAAGISESEVGHVARPRQ